MNVKMGIRVAKAAIMNVDGYHEHKNGHHGRKGGGHEHKDSHHEIHDGFNERKNGRHERHDSYNGFMMAIMKSKKV